jgi:hypothetical protein
MKSTLLTHTFVLLFTALFASSCYTQLQTTERVAHDGYYASGQRTAPERRAPVEERADEIENVEDYELGYEDGWVDAEAYYFVDEEAREWYLEHGASLAYTKPYRSYHTYRAYHWRPYDSAWFYSPYHYYTYYGVPHWRYGFSIHFGWGRPWYGWAHSSRYYGLAYYRYPFYDPYYYDAYWGGWYGYGYYNRPIVIYNNNTITNRSYSPRSTGLASSGRSSINRNRPDISSSRSAVRSNAQIGTGKQRTKHPESFNFKKCCNQPRNEYKERSSIQVNRPIHEPWNGEPVRIIKPGKQRIGRKKEQRKPVLRRICKPKQQFRTFRRIIVNRKKQVR